MVQYANRLQETAESRDTRLLMEFASLCAREGHECRLVGAGMPDHVPGWAFSDYSREYFKNDIDWILGHYHLYPDWLTNPAPKPRPEGFTGKIAEWAFDLHVDPEGLIAEANAKIDLWLMRYTEAGIFFPTLAKWNECRGGTPEEWLANGYCVKKERDYYTKRITTNYMFFPLSMNPEFYHPIAEKDYDIAMVGVLTQYYPLRLAISNEIQRFTTDHRLRLLFHPSPPDVYGAHTDAMLQNPALRAQYSVSTDYAERIAKSKMFVFCSSFATAPIAKYFEGMMAGTAVVADTPVNASELHFEPDKNFISIDASNWKEKILYYLDNTLAREEIALRGRETAVKYHTNEVRAKQLLERLKIEQGRST